MWYHHLGIFTIFILLHHDSRHRSGSLVWCDDDEDLFCPAPVVDAIGVTYKTVDRFNKLRKDNNVLTTSSKNGKFFRLHWCNRFGEDAVIELNGEKSTQIGKVNSKSILVGADDWMLVQYFDGQKYSKEICDGKPTQAWVSVRCEEGNKPSELKLIEEPAKYKTGVRHTSTVCYHLFEYNHPAACSPKPMSGGTVFVIVVLVLVVAYFLFGVLYRRFVRGAKGREQLPNHEFWEKFGNMMADGCAFVCRNEEHSNTYKGMAQQLNIDDEEEEDILPV